MLLLLIFYSIVGSETYFNHYKEKAELYLNREHFTNTPLTGDILVNSAKKVYDSIGVIVPLELALTQAQLESGMGLKGKSPKKNPFNIGEHNSKTTIKFNNTQEGVDAYYFLMAEKYLRCSTVDELLNNFVNCDNHRYATNKNYEKKVKNQYYFIKRWLNTNY
jgi:flagellum-specific peptidoglycan hydrolase FlgJ